MVASVPLRGTITPILTGPLGIPLDPLVPLEAPDPLEPLDPHATASSAATASDRQATIFLGLFPGRDGVTTAGLPLLPSPGLRWGAGELPSPPRSIGSAQLG